MATADKEPEQKRQKMALRSNMLLGMGNPLLDISATVTKDYLEKYGLEANNAILADEKHAKMYKEIVDQFEVDYIAGGATQNSMRIAQWILDTPNTCAYFGSVGKDEFCKTLKEKAVGAGVNVNYQEQDDHPTGTCAVLLTDDNRSMVANLAAANHFTIEHLKKPECQKIIESAGFYYVAGFFLTVSIESLLHVSQHAHDNNKVFTMNLSAPFLCEFFKDNMMKAMPFVDIIFGNETEALKFSEVHDYKKTDIKEIALELCKEKKLNSERSRMVIFTQGSGPTLVAQDGAVREFNVIPIKEADIVDTNGAGDAFVGGFLSQYAQGKDLEKCVNVGHYAANYIIQQSGVTTTGKPQIN